VQTYVNNIILQVKKVPEVGSRPDNVDFGEEDPHRGTDQEQPAGVPEDDEDTVLMNKPEDRATSFFSQPGILAGTLGTACTYYTHLTCNCFIIHNSIIKYYS
jgi:hypothetical protein